MKLKPKKIPIRTGNKWIAVLTEKTAHLLDLHAGDRIQLKNGRTQVTAIVDVSEDTIGNECMGLFIETYEKIKAKRGDLIEVNIAEKPFSTIYIREKLEGKRLTAAKIDEIIKDVVQEDLSDVELAYFVSACFTHPLSNRETIALTKSIVKHGNRFKLKDKIVMDKHCIGGVSGNRTSMIIVPIVTAFGLKMPKTSSRAITSPAGTADTMECLCNVTLDAKKLKSIVNKVGGFIAWGGGVDLAAADDKMIRVRHPLSLDPEGMLLASIMAKKFAVGANHVLIDIPCGPEVKVTEKEARHLKKRFQEIGKILGMKTKVILTHTSQPIGRGIGPLLETFDVLNILQNKQEGGRDLKAKSLMMAGLLLELSGKVKRGQGIKAATEILESGKAWKQMQKIIKAQGPRKLPKLGKFTAEIKAKENGVITEIDNKVLSRIARLAGAPLDKEAGIYLHRKLYEKVKKGDVLYTIYSDSRDRLQYSRKFARQTGYQIESKKNTP